MPRPNPPKGHLDPPNKIGYTYSQLLAKPHLSSPILPPIGFERQFQRRPMLRGGEGDEAFEVGVLKYKQGPGIVSMSIEIDSELLVGRDKSCKIQMYGPTISNFHLRFYSVRTNTSSIVCMNDLSSGSGYILNGKHFPSSAKYKLGGQVVGSRMVVLKDGDEVQIPNTPQVMKYKHNSAHFAIQPSINTHISDYALFSTTSSRHYIDTNHWRIHNYPLGDGTFGVVNLATHKSGGVQAAIKTIDSRTSTATWRERLESEVGNMKLLNHPNVMKVLDKIKNTGQSNAKKIKGEGKDEEEEDNDKSWDWTRMGIWKAHIVFELATGGDLFSYQESQGALSEDETKFISWQLVLGLDHLHYNQVAHRDLKLENILLHNRNNFPRILIGDFGFSTTLSSMIDTVPSGQGASLRYYAPAGTILYLPPERLKNFCRTVRTAGLGESLHGQDRREKIGQKWFEEEMQLDDWALGAVIFHLIAFKHPFRGASQQTSIRSSTLAIKKEAKGKNKGKDKGKGRLADAGKAGRGELEETISQFDSQHQTQEAGVAKTKRKFLELDIDDPDEDDDEEYESRNASRGWAEYRTVYGEGTVGTGKDDSQEVRAAGRVLEEIKLFADKHSDEWLPYDSWDAVSSQGKDFVGKLLKMRVHQRMTISKAKDHEWFTSSMDELEKLYNQVVIKGIHQFPAQGSL